MIKKIKPVYILIFTLLLPLANVHAELQWNKKEGWRLENDAIKSVFGDVLNKTPQSGVSLFEKALEAEKKGDKSTALSIYKQVYTKYSTSALAPEALYHTGLLRADNHQFAEANKVFTKIFSEYTNYENYDAVIQAEFDIASRLMAGERPYYWGIIPGFRDYSSSEKYFETVVKHAPYSKLAPEALFNAAILAQKDDETDKAIDALERLVYGYSGSELLPDAYLMLANIHKGQVFGPTYDQGETRDALGYYQDFITLFPTDSKVEEAREGVKETKETLAESEYRIGEFYYVNRNNPKAAKIFYNRAVALAPKAEAAIKSRERLNQIEAGKLAPKQFIDYVLGRYETEEEVDFMAEAANKEETQDNS